MTQDTYWYLASPYGKFPEGHEAAFKLACKNAALLLQAGIPTFAPIAHSHPLVAHGGLKAIDHDFWINVMGRPMMKGAHGLIFLEAPSWQSSSGMHEEIVEFVKAGKPIVFMQPGRVPEALIELDPPAEPPIQSPAPTGWPEDRVREVLFGVVGGNPDAMEAYDFAVVHGADPHKAAQNAAVSWAVV